MPVTQDDRLLAIETQLGKDFLLLNRISGTESLSKLYAFEVDLLHEEFEPSMTPTVVDAESIVGQGVSVSINQRDGTRREISGIVNRFSQGGRNTRFTFYTATIVPHIWILTKKFQSRIFQNQTVPDILRDVFTGFRVEWEIQGAMNRRNYCVQYRESDFDFASRLMEEEGIYYYFSHEKGEHKMIVADSPLSHRECPSKQKIPFFIDVTRKEEDFVSSVHFWRADHEIQTGKVTYWDYNFELPTKNFEHSEESRFVVGENKKLELYDYPSGPARKYDGIDRSGSDQSEELSHIDPDAEDTVKHSIESFDARYRVLRGGGDCSAMTAGFRFELFNHPSGTENGKFVITQLSLDAEQNPTYISDEAPDSAFTNTFSCIEYGEGAPPFRPLKETAKPLVHGSQTAFVVGPPGEEIFTDKYGRVKVQFHWDRDSKADAASSCWVRVAQSWAGNKWGSMFIPRVGMEVIVDFLEGDPDQPIITGCVYNPKTMPPYTLPDEKTKSTIKTNSSKGGGGFNELRFEDKKGQEQIFIHAEKNTDTRVKNDAKELIKHDRHLIIENKQFEKVKRDKHLKVEGDHNEKVDGTISVEAGVDIDTKAGTKFAVDAGTEIHLKSGASLVIEAGASLTLKVGGSFINLNAGGVFINGTIVMINSGGAAGSGSGSHPMTPELPLEADDADPGTRPETPPARVPPPRPIFTSPAALVLINASQSGAAFCEICSRQSR